MQEFRRVRVAIDSLIDEAKESIQKKSLSGVMEKLEQARGLSQELKQLSTDAQTAIVAKRERTIANLVIIADKTKKPAIKKLSAKETSAQAVTL